MEISVLSMFGLEEKLCTGCGACYNICPNAAIQMLSNREGFLYPVVDKEKCVNCGLCKNKCPAVGYINENNNRKPIVYIAFAEDKVREMSTSGGMFYIVAKEVLNRGGAVYGAAFDDSQNLNIIACESLEDVHCLQGTKYLQANTKLCFREIKDRIQQGQEVLFSGLPCQVAACKKYIGKSKKLYTMDLFCHGAPSPGLFKSYIAEIGAGKQIVKTCFRDKRYGWNYNNFTLSILFSDGSSYISEDSKDDYLVAFLKAISTRKSCDKCKFCSIPRVGDFSVGDCWGIEKYNNNLNDSGGVSWFLLNSSKAINLFDSIKNEFKVIQESNIKTLKKMNLCSYSSKPIDSRRDRFFDLYEKYGARKALHLVVHNKHDVGLVGVYSGPNYGNAVSYYSLYCILNKMGYEVLMIERIGRDYRKVCSEVKDFLEKHYSTYDIPPVVNDWNELRNLNDQCESFLVGSDQIWKEGLYIPHFYALDFVNDNRRKIVYGASFGQDHFIGKVTNIEEMRFYLQRIDAIGVREETAVNICANTFGVDAVTVVDPVFLAGKKLFDTLADESRRKIPDDKYIFSYMLEPNLNKDNMINAASDCLKLSQVNTTGMIISAEREKGTSLILEKDLAVVDWIKFLKFSDYVITDSFHGMCMSIIFNKNFIVLEHENRGNDRFYSLLKKLGLEKRILKCPTDITDLKIIAESPITYKDINGIIETEAEKAYKWLQTALMKEINRNMSKFDILRAESEKRELQLEEKLNRTLRKRIKNVDKCIKEYGILYFLKLVRNKLWR